MAACLTLSLYFCFFLQFLFYGVFVCLDCFLHNVTYLPLRFLSAWILLFVNAATLNRYTQSTPWATARSPA